LSQSRFWRTFATWVIIRVSHPFYMSAAQQGRVGRDFSCFG
jgi:hypothetical protein